MTDKKSKFSKAAELVDDEGWDAAFSYLDGGHDPKSTVKVPGGVSRAEIRTHHAQAREKEKSKQLKLKAKKNLWNKKNTAQKFFWFLPRFIFWSLLGLPVAYSLIGITVEIFFNYTIKLF